MDFVIRSATESDAAWIKQLYKTEKQFIGDFNQYQVWKQYITGTGPNKFIVIGQSAFCHYKYSVRYDAYVIEEMAVDASCKGLGIGKHIVQAMIQKAQRNRKKLIVKCNVENASANMFYERCGLRNSGYTYTKNRNRKQNVWTI